MHKDCTQTMTRSEPLDGPLHCFHFRFEILGLLATAHYNKFLAYSDTAVSPSPLNALLCSDTFWRWSKEREEAFQVSKQVLTSADVLAHFNPHLPQLSTNRWSVYTYCFLQICEKLKHWWYTWGSANQCDWLIEHKEDNNFKRGLWTC